MTNRCRASPPPTRSNLFPRLPAQPWDLASTRRQYRYIMGCSQPANQQSENVVPRAASGSENHDVMLVTVPLNHIPGRPLSINTLQGPMTVHVPPTVGPGQKFHCKVPRTTSNSTSNRSGIYQKNNNSQTNPIYSNRNQANPYPGGPRAGSHSHSPNMQPAHERKRTHSGTHAPYANQYTNQRSEPNLALHYQHRGKGYVEALYDLKSNSETRLSFRKGERILLLKDHDKTWWYGELKGKKGYFPVTYVKQVSVTRTSLPSPEVGGRTSRTGSGMRSSLPNIPTTPTIGPPQPIPQGQQKQWLLFNPKQVNAMKAKEVKDRKQATLYLFNGAFRGDVDMVKTAIQMGAQVNDRNDDGETPIFNAAYKGRVNVIQFLVQQKADVNAVESKYGTTPLEPACYGSHNLPAVKLLVRLGARVNHQRKGGDTPLHQAVKYNHPDIVQYLVQEAKANKFLANSEGQTPLQLAGAHPSRQKIAQVLGTPQASRPGGPGVGGLSQAARIKRGKRGSEMVVTNEDVAWSKNVTEEEFRKLNNRDLERFLKAVQKEFELNSVSIRLIVEEEYNGEGLWIEDDEGLLKVLEKRGRVCKIQNIKDVIKKRSGDQKTQIFQESDIRKEKLLGEGHFAKAWLVTIKRTNQKAVLKVEKQSLDNLKELKAMLQLPKHDNVLPLLGIVTIDGNFCLLTPYCARGSLDKLHKQIDMVSEKKFRKVALDIALGVRALHNFNIVHRDLACRNIFMDNNNRAIIADYGLARKIDEDSYYRSSSSFPWQWTAPEALDGRYDFQCDIWSVGVTYWEILTKGELPYKRECEKRGINIRVLEGKVEAQKLIKKGELRLGLPAELTGPIPSLSFVSNLLDMCMSVVVKKRPDATMLAKSLGWETNLVTEKEDLQDMERYHKNFNNINYDIPYVRDNGALEKKGSKI